MIETWGLSCVLLRKIARLPAAWVNISLYVCVSVQSVQSILSRWLIWQFEHVRWWAHRNSHGSICWVRRPNQPSWGMLPVVITNMASSCLCNICSTLLISLACLHRKWRTKWLNPLRPHHRLLCCVCVCVCLQTRFVNTNTPSFYPVKLGSPISHPQAMICIICLYSLARELVLFKLCWETTNRDRAW